MSRPDQRHHLESSLMRESLVDRDVMASTEALAVRMLPDVHVVKIGATSIIDRGHELVHPLVAALRQILTTKRLVIGTGGGLRSRHVFSIGIDLGLPTGVVAIPPEMFGHLLPLLIRAVPGVIFNGVPPYSLWEHPPSLGRIPPHRTDAGCFLLAETFGCKSLTLVKDVDGLYDADPKLNPSASLIREIGVAELRKRAIPSLPFDRVLIDLLERARLVDRFQVINGRRPELLGAALNGEHVGTTVHADR